MNEVARGLVELTQLHLNLFTQTEKQNVGSWGQSQTVTPTPVVQRPWINPPEGFVSFDESGAQAVPAVGALVTLATHTVPSGFDGVINAYSWNDTGGGFVDGSGDLVAQILRNGAPIRNYNNILTQRGTLGIPRPISPIRIYSGDIITLVVTHVANALLVGNLVGSILGYDYPSQN